MNTRDLGVEIGSKLCHSSLNHRRGVLSLSCGNVLDPPDLHKADGGKDGAEDQKHTDPARYRVAPTAPGGLSHEGLRCSSSMDVFVGAGVGPYGIFTQE